jgi:2-oxoisovalerate dehydrogenase E1 component
MVRKADVVVRMPCGGGTKQDRFISQTNEAWFTKTRIKGGFIQHFLYDAKGLLNESINDPNQYYSSNTNSCTARFIRKYPPITTPYLSEKQPLLREGNDVTVISFGAAVHWLKL